MLLVGVWLVITAFFGYQLQYLSPDFEFEKFFPKNDPDISFYEGHLRKFSYDNDFLLLILESEKGVFDPVFLQNIGKLSDSLRSVSSIEQIISPVDFKHLLSGPMGITPVPLIHPDDPDRYPADSTRIFEHPIYRSFFDRDARSLMIRVTHKHLEDPESADQLLTSIHKVLAAFPFDEVRIAGKLVAQDEFISLIRKDFSLFLGCALILSFLLLIVIFRSVKIALLPYLISLTSLIWLLGLMAFLGYPITILGSLIPPVILFVSSSDAIHLINSYRNSADDCFTARLKMAVHRVFIPTLLTSVTTAIGFFSLIAINTEPIQHLGIFTGIGVVFAFLITFGFGPLLIRRSYPPIAPSRTQRSLALWVFKHQKAIITASIILIVASVYGISQLKTDAYLLKDLPEDSSVREDFDFVDTHYGGSKPWELAYWPRDASSSVWDQGVMKEAFKIHQFLREQYPIGQLWSPVTFLKYGNQMTSGGHVQAFEFPDEKNYAPSRRAIRQFTSRNELPKLISEQEDYARFAGYIPEYGSRETIRRNEMLLDYLDKHIDRDVIGYRITGTTYLIDKSHGLLSANLLKGLAFAIGMISLILGLYFKSFKILIISIIPNIIPLLAVAGFMGITGIALQLTTSIIFAVAFGIVVDDTIHLVSVYQKYRNESPDSNRVFTMIRTFRSAGKAILITTVIVVAGFGLFIFSAFGATYYLGLFMGLSLIIALVTDLTLLPLLLHYGSKNKLGNKKLTDHE